MKLKPYQLEDGGDKHGGYEFWCPGCARIHYMCTYHEGHNRPRGPRPQLFQQEQTAHGHSFFPALKITHSRGNWSTGWPALQTDTGPLITDCHLYVINDKLIYLGDCSHELAGCTVDMVDVPCSREQADRMRCHELGHQHRKHQGHPPPRFAQVVTAINLHINDIPHEQQHMPGWIDRLEKAHPRVNKRRR